MLAGKRFRLNAAILAIDSSGVKAIAVTVPPGSIIEIIHGRLPEDTRMVDVRWDGRSLEMFAEDIQDRSEEITGRTASA